MFDGFGEGEGGEKSNAEPAYLVEGDGFFCHEYESWCVADHYGDGEDEPIVFSSDHEQLHAEID